MIKITKLRKSFKEVVALNLDSLEIKDAGVYAILGPNGSGKSTLIKSILGMVIPDDGDVVVADQNIKGAWDYRNNISYLPQVARFPENLSVQELFDMIKDLRDQSDEMNKYIELFGLESYLDKGLNTLSGGTKQKVNLVLCFMFDTPIIILDEPSTGLDEDAMTILKYAMEEKRDKIIILTSHVREFVEDVATKKVELKEGVLCLK